MQQLQERRLDVREWLVLLVDGKTFASDQLVIALGVTTTGERRVLGLVQTATENKAPSARAAPLRDLEARGFVAPHGLLVVLDGAKALRAAVRHVYGPDVAVQRCQWHKRGNVVGYLSKPLQIVWRLMLQAAYAQPTHARAAGASIWGAWPTGQSSTSGQVTPPYRLLDRMTGSCGSSG
ncbi:MAG: transposase [Gemmatimonadaceae bacterium]